MDLGKYIMCDEEIAPCDIRRGGIFPEGDGSILENGKHLSMGKVSSVSGVLEHFVILGDEGTSVGAILTSFYDEI